jgi:hypothetical protein
MTPPPTAGDDSNVANTQKPTGFLAKAKQAAAALKAEYEAGKQGDDSPSEPIWATPAEQVAGLLKVLHLAPTPKPPTDDELNADAAEVAVALRSVDWAGVRAGTVERTSTARRAMRDMADQVDWAKAQPVAAQVSSALIAAVATGQLGVGGHLGSTVARAIVDQSGLAQRVAANLNEQKITMPPDFRSVIDTTAEG